MFTGLIEEVGKVKSLVNFSNGKKISIECKKVLEGIKIDDSISINGICLTVVEHNHDFFSAIAIEETLRKSNLGSLTPQSKVNLERAMLPTARLGGHLVQGHIDCTSKVIKIENEGAGKLIYLSLPNQYYNYIVEKGSICINGVSLTVASKPNKESFSVAIIPHTWEVTTIGQLSIGSIVNLEFDIIAKYVENMIKPFLPNNSEINLKEFLNTKYGE